ncbi:hypothetical protein [Nocardioides speluncae]|uniref:hypothetical protein n=1 Tax=Nocardioides speluncae TaxID=2670337 RepID=UPI0012B164F7|nr:hypothetical protein [Nocardioides speluncae]
MAGCLTEHQIDTAMLVVFASGSIAIVALIGCALAWLPSSAFQQRRPTYLDGIAALFSAGCLIVLIFNDQVWLAAVAVAAILAFFPVVLILRKRASAFSAGVELAPAWRRGNSAVKYGAPALAAVGVLVAAGSLAWVLPAELC